MCLMCSIQKWSRQIATMLPWLVIPFIGLWSLSQLLPPAFRFEITSPRLACVLVLLFTLFWYEILVPKLSAWQLRRDALMRERKRVEAIELHKLRKFATKRCRNCLNPYRDQNPGGSGRFMCSYCGHVSKRPFLDLPVHPRIGIGGNGIFKDLVGGGGKLLNGRKGLSDNGWMCGQEWLENGSWCGGGGGVGSFSGKSSYLLRDGNRRLFGGEEDSLSEKSYSRVIVFVGKLLMSFFLGVKWLCRRVFRIGFSGDDTLSDANGRRMLSTRGENGVNCNESRGAKARRKAEEKKQARLEKELLEEEERKQREEIARLVEERRKLRDEIEAEKNRGKTTLPAKEKCSRKEAEKRRQERRRERDMCSSKSNSDVEEVERRVRKESERKIDLDKKSGTTRQESKTPGSAGNVRSPGTEIGHGTKSTANSYSRGNAGARYFDRMKGSLLSSSKAFSGTSFFAKGSTQSPSTIKDYKSSNSADHVNNSAYRRESSQADHQPGRLSLNADEKNATRPVFVETQSRPAPKKSWHQLFTGSSSLTQPSNAKVISRPTPKAPAKDQSPPLSCQPLGAQSYNNPISFGLPSPFPLPSYPRVSSGCGLGFSSPIEPIFPVAEERLHNRIHEEQELFEDPCYVPDPASLLGPVSESLDNFQLDLGANLPPDMGVELSSPKKTSSAADFSKQSPIESPLSRLRIVDNKHSNSSMLPISPKVHDMLTPVNANEKGVWQMWNSSTLGQGGLGLVGGLPSWLMSSDGIRPNQEDVVHPLAQKVMGSHLKKEDLVLSDNCSPQTGIFCTGQNGGPISSPNGHDPWLEKAFFPSLSDSENYFLSKTQQYSVQNGMIKGSPKLPPAGQTHELSSSNCWSK